ncbi:hypothetical protein GGR51DRAFT_556788 [Nemania sp. FL0031]|nr:hypothetical protein GGR51DRAFT_556788 [Nemania sp. FL0031]
MTSQDYGSEAILAELRAAVSSNSAEECGMCLLLNKIECSHLTAEQYASLKATKRSMAAEGEEGFPLRVFECGHVYRGNRRAWRNISGPKIKTGGMCSQCWRQIGSGGRRVRLDTIGKVRPRLKKAPSKSRVDGKRGDITQQKHLTAAMIAAARAGDDLTLT